MASCWHSVLLASFNASVWDSYWVLIPASTVIFIYIFFRLKKGYFYHFDPKYNPDTRLKDAGDFEPHAKRYHDLAKLAIAISCAAIGFLISIRANQRPAISEFDQNLELVTPIVVGFFGNTVALLIAFMLSHTFWYEEYCHSPDHSTYSRWKYALSQSLGWSGMISFLLGFAWLASNLFHS